MTAYQYELGIIGAGKMGSALVCGLVSRGAIKAEQVIATDVFDAALTALSGACPGVTTVANNISQVVSQARILLVAVKPQDAEAALKSIAAGLGEGQLVVSIMAGVTIGRISGILGDDAAIVRVMPNVCCEVAEGAFGYACNAAVASEDRELLHSWFNAIGAAEELKEALLDAVTGLSGSGPAFVALFIEALADGGVAAGLPRAVAQRLAAQTVLGAASWVCEKGGPAELKDMVCSPAGTTITGVRKLEAGGIRTAAIEAVVAATERSRELGK